MKVLVPLLVAVTITVACAKVIKYDYTSPPGTICGVCVNFLAASKRVYKISSGSWLSL